MRTRTQRFISALLAVAMMFVMIPVSAITVFAASSYDYDCGKNGSNVTAHLDVATKTLTISGTGEMADYTSSGPNTTAPWFDDRASISSVIVKEGVTTIGAYSFNWVSTITKIEFPSSGLTSIGDYAFCHTAPTSIVVPDTVTKMGNGVFASCSDLVNATVPTLSESLFLRNFNLTNLTITGITTSIPTKAFYGCKSLSNFEVPDTVTEIGNQAFKGCISLTNITFPEGIQTIGKEAFARCVNLETLRFPSSLEFLGEDFLIADGGDTSFDNYELDLFNQAPPALKDVYYAGTKDEWEALLNKRTAADAKSPLNCLVAYSDDGYEYQSYDDKVTFHFSEPVSVKVTFNYNHEGLTPASEIKTVTYGRKVSTPENLPTVPGYRIAGWYTAAENGEKFDFDQAVTADITLYAQWEAIPTYKLTINSPVDITVKNTADNTEILFNNSDNAYRVTENTTVTIAVKAPADGDVYEWTVDGKTEIGQSFNYTVSNKNVEIGLTVLKALKLTTDGDVDLTGVSYTTDESSKKTYTGNGWTYTEADNTLTITGAGTYDLTKTEPLKQSGENVQRLACNVVLGNGVKAKLNSNNNVTVKQGGELTGGSISNSSSNIVTVENGGKVSGGSIYAVLKNEGTISGTAEAPVTLNSLKAENTGTIENAVIVIDSANTPFTSTSGTVKNCLFTKFYGYTGARNATLTGTNVENCVFSGVNTNLTNIRTITSLSGKLDTVAVPDIAASQVLNSFDADITFVGSPKLTVTIIDENLTHINNYKISANSIPGVKGTVEQDKADKKTATFTPDGTKDIVLNQKPTAGEFTMTNDGAVFPFDYENHKAEIKSDNYTDFEVKYYQEVDGEEKEVPDSESGVSAIGDYIVKVVANGETIEVGHFSIRSPSLKLGDAKIIRIQDRNAYGDLEELDPDDFTKDENGIYKIPAGMIITIEPSNKAALADSGSVFDHWDITGGTLYKEDKQTEVNPKDEQLTFVMPATTDKVSIKLMTRDATIDESPDLLGVAVITGTAVVSGAILAWQGYQLGTELYLNSVLPDWAVIPNNRMELAALLWRDAGQPVPESQALYSDIDANDADAQNAARWAVENELISLPDADAPDTFQPYTHVSRIAVIKAWKKAQELKKNA